MSDPKAATSAPHVLTVQEMYDLETFDFPVATGPDGRVVVWKVRRLGVLTLLMEGFLQNPLLMAAMEIMDEIKTWVGEGVAFDSIFQNLTDEKRTTLLGQLREYACRAVLEPRLTLDPASDREAFPVALIDADVLFRLWKYQPPNASVTRPSEVAAHDFRPPPASDAPAAGSDGQGVRPATVDLGADAAATGHA